MANLARTFAAVVRSALEELRYIGPKSGVVAADNGATLDVQLGNGDTIRARKRVGLAPGDASRVNVGIGCIVEYDSQRVAYVSEYSFDAQSSYDLAPEGKPVARHGDLVDVPVSTADPVLGVVIPPDPAVAAAVSNGASTLPVGTPVTIQGVVAVTSPQGAIVGSTTALFA